MFMKFKKADDTIFLDEYTSENISDKKVNIILSPSLYWVKKVSLPVKTLRMIRQLLSSIFEDILPDGSYSYYVYKKDNDYIAIAYEDKKILDLLNAKNVSLANVVHIYFAQTELEHIESAKRVNESQSIYVKDGLVILIPNTWLTDTSDLDLKNINLSNNTITLKQFNHIVDSASLLKIGSILFFIACLLIIQWSIISHKTNKILAHKDKLFAQYHLKETTMQNEAVYEHLHHIYQKQTKLREYISEILKLSLSKNEKIEYIKLKNNLLVVSITGVKNKVKIINALRAKGLKVRRSELKGVTLKMEFSL